ncbi:NADH-quinone reductase NQR2/RnfD, partial [gut metagenome]
MTFGGLGQNLFNPAIAARVFLLISFPVAMTSFSTVPSGLVSADAYSGATLLASVKEGLAQGLTLPEIYQNSGFTYLQT